MDRIKFLYSGEVKRNWKYGITAASLAAALFWVLALQFSNASNITSLFPMLLFIDATIMSLLLAGVTLIFETQENVLKSFLVTPVSIGEYLFAKSLAVVTSAITTFVLLTVYGLLFKSLSVNLIGMLFAVIIVAFAFGQLGLILTYYSKDFTDLLIGMFKFSFLFALPTIVEFTKLFQARWLTAVQYLNPTKHALVLMQAAATPVPTRDVLLAALYLLVLCAGGFMVSLRLFDRYAVKGGGA